jgi:hypothetical protein
MPTIAMTTSQENSHIGFSLGEPVVDSLLDTDQIANYTVTIDGQPVQFSDTTIPSRLHDVMYAGTTTPARASKFDCGIFGAMMLGARYEDSDNYPFEPNVDGNIPLHLSPLLLRGSSDKRLHVLIPATCRKADEPGERLTYLSKLGTEGPICLSGLKAAMQMYRATSAQPIRLKA